MASSGKRESGGRIHLDMEVEEGTGFLERTKEKEKQQKTLNTSLTDKEIIEIRNSWRKMAAIVMNEEEMKTYMEKKWKEETS